MTEQNEREAAWLRWKPDFDVSANLRAAKCGFYAGYSAGQTQWRPIRTADDLPKELDWYLFRDRLGGAKAELFNFQDWNMLNDITKGVFLMLYVAWQPIQPYTESDKGGK